MPKVIHGYEIQTQTDKSMKTLIIDNYDSFTYNLYQAFGVINDEEPIVIQNDQFTLMDILQMDFDNIVLSPGPGHPANIKDFGVCASLIEHINVPILGICLGHQGIIHHFGGQVVHAPEPIHGQLSKIIHQNDLLFANIPSSFQAVRYHSLIANTPIPDCLKAIAHTKDGLIMAVKHRTRPIWGLQYHPESICSEYGLQVLKNFHDLTRPKKRKLASPTLASSKRGYQYKLDIQRIPVENHHKADTWIQQFQEHQHLIWLDSSLLISDYSRFSIWGALNGPMSYHIQYDMHTKTIIRTQGETQETIQQSIFDYLKHELCHYEIEKTSLPFEFACGFVGYFGYELYQETLNMQARHHSAHPDAQFLFLDRAIVFDHLEQSCYQLTLLPYYQNTIMPIWFDFKTNVPPPPKKELISKPTLAQDASTYQKKIEKCLKYIRNGESYEICLTNRLNYNSKVSGLDLYQQMRCTQKAPYSAYLRFAELELACSSMERFLKIDQNGKIETKPIKGTMPRGKTPVQDQMYRKQLQNDLKFRAENLMIVDLLRNDLSKICEMGSVKVPKLMQVESYQTVHQLVSTITGTLKPQLDAIDCLKALFPGGSMTGAPKIRTVEIIEKLETSYRGIYSGALGYLSLNGAVDLNIVIRTATVTPHLTQIGMGGAIIALSNPHEEFEETLLKTKSLQQAIANISQSDTSLLESVF